MTLKDLQKKLGNLLDDVIDRQLFEQIGKKSAQNVKTRTRRGFGVEQEGGKAKKLKGLSTPYKKQRKALKKKGELSGETSPAKSNLTKSGKMIHSITHEASSDIAVVKVEGNLNEKKAKGVTDKGRPFMNLTKAEVRDVADIIEDKIKSDIKKQGL